MRYTEYRAALGKCPLLTSCHYENLVWFQMRRGRPAPPESRRHLMMTLNQKLIFLTTNNIFCRGRGLTSLLFRESLVVLASAEVG